MGSGERSRSVTNAETCSAPIALVGDAGRLDDGEHAEAGHQQREAGPHRHAAAAAGKLAGGSAAGPAGPDRPATRYRRTSSARASARGSAAPAPSGGPSGRWCRGRPRAGAAVAGRVPRARRLRGLGRCRDGGARRPRARRARPRGLAARQPVRVAAGQQLVEHDAERVDVARGASPARRGPARGWRTRASSARSPVCGRASRSRSAAPAAWRCRSRAASARPSAVDQDVRRLEVAVDDQVAGARTGPPRRRGGRARGAAVDREPLRVAVLGRSARPRRTP